VHRPESGHWWLVMLNGMSVAFAGYVDGITNPAFGYMIRAGVIPEARGRGLQRKLLRVREHHARRNGYCGLVTDTTDNIPSANNLIRCGYRLFEPHTRWAFEHSLYWRKVFK
jgi:GNAT superfamily N-acetyltransferase